MLLHYILIYPIYLPILQGFSFISASTATSDASGSLRRYCPFLSLEEEEGLTSCALLLMMAVNRISQVNLASMQTRSVLKLLIMLKSKLEKNENVDIIYKELASSSINLAGTLCAKRDFASSLGMAIFYSSSLSVYLHISIIHLYPLS